MRRPSLELRLKLLADAALVGLPNAGKSSLIRRISNAKPKVAEYPFTTLAPVLGTVDAPDGRQLVVADVPGLIEGASQGIGLGHEFLAHLERAQLLVHVIDVAAGDPHEAFTAIDTELREYGAGLHERPQVVVLNKIDLLPEPPVFQVEDERVQAVFAVSVRDRGGHRGLQAGALLTLPAPGGDGRAASGRARRFPGVPPAGEGAANIPDPSHRPRFPRRRPAPAAGGARGGLACRRSAPGAEIEIGDDLMELG